METLTSMMHPSNIFFIKLVIDVFWFLAGHDCTAYCWTRPANHFHDFWCEWFTIGWSRWYLCKILHTFILFVTYPRHFPITSSCFRLSWASLRFKVLPLWLAWSLVSTSNDLFWHKTALLFCVLWVATGRAFDFVGGGEWLS